MSLRTLIHGEVYYYGSKGVEKGFLFIDGSKIRDVGEELPPEYELSELVLRYEKPAIIVHGFSALVPGLEFPFRGLDPVQPPIDEVAVEKLVLASLSAAYANGVTLPILVDTPDCKVSSVISRHGLTATVISPKPCAKPGVYNILIEEDMLVYNDKVIGKWGEVVCDPRSIGDKCLILDTRREHSRSPQAWFSKSDNPGSLLRTLVQPYRVLGLDSGFVERGSLADLVVYDLSDPVLSLPLSKLSPVVVAMRGGPQVVFVGGEVAFEKGEHLLVQPPSILEYIASL
ncbi:hypothetical protein [Thermogladius calderae]|nr:hypothetical protein [Thermogladius calderae]